MWWPPVIPLYLFYLYILILKEVHEYSIGKAILSFFISLFIITIIAFIFIGSFSKLPFTKEIIYGIFSWWQSL